MEEAMSLMEATMTKVKDTVEEEVIEKEIPQNFDHQILLYAKHWYKRSSTGNILRDLRVLMSYYSGCYYKDISEADVKEALANCFADYAPEYNRGRWIQEMLGWDWLNPLIPRRPEQVMIGALAITKGKYVDPSELLPVLKKEHTEQGKELIAQCKKEKENALA